ncbi:zinc finger protein 700-like [Neocloeon triangulifer]|uniref:zinc finger protein 700-like n=1 Tax=Neocloeon triangulifer TaxID=2078957 RepID=UPI00286EEF64|nr:zinc finger protein 700-like [Neocloeon triangulifer]
MERGNFPKCLFCKAPVINQDGSDLLLYNIEFEKLAEIFAKWRGWHFEEEDGETLIGEYWCMFCAMDARFACEKNSSTPSVFRELIIWPFSDTVFNYFKRGWMKSCSVPLKKLRDEEICSLGNLNHDSDKATDIQYPPSSTLIRQESNIVAPEGEDSSLLPFDTIYLEERSVDYDSLVSEIKLEPPTSPCPSEKNFQESFTYESIKDEFFDYEDTLDAPETLNLMKSEDKVAEKDRPNSSLPEDGNQTRRKRAPPKRLADPMFILDQKKARPNTQSEKCNYCRDKYGSDHLLRKSYCPACKLWFECVGRRNNHFRSEMCLKCPICSMQFENISQITKHVQKLHYRRSLNRTGSAFQCNICKEDLSSEEHRKEHKQKFHTNNEIMKVCEICCEKFRFSQFDQHWKKEHSMADPLISCNYCVFKTDSETDIKQHHKNHDDHTSLPIFICQYCTFQSNNLSFYNYHVCPKRPKVECPVCGLQMYYEFLKEHFDTSEYKKKCRAFRPRCKTIADVHQQSLATCKLCKKSFCTIQHLESHTRTSHGANAWEQLPDLKYKDSGFTCRFCGAHRACAESLQLHQKNVHRDLIQSVCGFCGNIFRNPRLLQTHMIKVHKLDDVGYHCITCNFFCFEKQDFQEHLKCKFANNEKLKSNVDPVEKHKCKICKKDLTSAYSLKLHIAALHPHVQLHCGYCMRIDFEDEYRLRLHILVSHLLFKIKASSHVINNSARKLHECNLCVEFIRHKNLISHLETNHKNDLLIEFTCEVLEEDREWKCKICAKTFTSSKFIPSHFLGEHFGTGTDKLCTCNLCGALMPDKIDVKEQHLSCSHTETAGDPLFNLAGKFLPCSSGLSVGTCRNRTKSPVITMKPVPKEKKRRHQKSTEDPFHFEKRRCKLCNINMKLINVPRHFQHYHRDVFDRGEMESNIMSSHTDVSYCRICKTVIELGKLQNHFREKHFIQSPSYSLAIEELSRVEPMEEVTLDQSNLELEESFSCREMVGFKSE